MQMCIFKTTSTKRFVIGSLYDTLLCCFMIVLIDGLTDGGAFYSLHIGNNSKLTTLYVGSYKVYSKERMQSTNRPSDLALACMCLYILKLRQK